MTKTAQERTNIIGLMAIGVVSALLMLWLFWRFPIITCIATVAVLVAFGISARLARLTENESRAERSKQGAIAD
jgi:CHASE2 domain-containing sensor protein